MRYRFDQFLVDTEQFAVSANGEPVHLEPLLFDLLAFFLKTPNAIVSRDDLIDAVWRGRIVADSTIAGAIKGLRTALGDSGETQRYVRTVRGRGFQWIGSAELLVPETPTRIAVPASTAEQPQPTVGGRPPRIAVLPLEPIGLDPDPGGPGDALAQEIILELSRLHWLAVIARGSAFKFRGGAVDLGEVAAVLDTDYVLTGTLVRQGAGFAVSVELNRTADQQVVWAERFVADDGELLALQTSLAARIVAAIEPRIQQAESMRSRARSTESLDAWSAYHLGLWHMFRFNAPDNGAAQGLFERAVELDPQFARALAGLSFTHFQNSFLRFEDDAARETQAAHDFAARALDLDPLDPFVNLSMGRAEWLAGRVDAAEPWMKRSIDLSPNYAFAIYNRALVGTLQGEGDQSEVDIARAIELSPIDPLNYAMLATRAMTHLVRGDYAAAATWAGHAVKAPNAHILIFVIAAIAHQLSGDGAAARQYLDSVRRLNPLLTRAEFFDAFPMQAAGPRSAFEDALASLAF